MDKLTEKLPKNNLTRNLNILAFPTKRKSCLMYHSYNDSGSWLTNRGFQRIRMPCHYLLPISASLCAYLSLRDGPRKEAWQEFVSILYVQIDRRVKSTRLARSVLVMLRFSCASMIDAVLFSHYYTFYSSAG